MPKEATKRLEALRRLPAQGDEPLLVDLSWSFPVLTLRKLVVQCVECGCIVRTVKTPERYALYLPRVFCFAVDTLLVAMMKNCLSTALYLLIGFEFT